MEAFLLIKQTEPRKYGFSPRDSKLSKLYTWYLFYDLFQGIWILDGQCVNNKGSFGEVQWNGERWGGGGGTFWVDVSCENCTLLTLLRFSTKMFKKCAFFLGHLHNYQPLTITLISSLSTLTS
jgi:hypothetical protein